MMYIIVSYFIGDIGGQLGLCLGASLLTVLEFLEFLYALIKRTCQGILKQKPNTTKTVSVKENGDVTADALITRHFHSTRL